MTDRDFDILCTAADAGRALAVEDFAEAILASCPGPRCADAYARQSVWRLMRAGFLDDDGGRITRFTITPIGRRFLESTEIEI